MGAESRLRILAAAVILTVAGCADPADRGLGPACASGLDAAERALSAAKANSVGKAVDWTRAAGLIAAARTQRQFSEYQNCVLKAKRARELISRHN